MIEQQMSKEQQRIWKNFRDKYVFEPLEKLEEGSDFEILEESVEKNGEVKVRHNETGAVMTVAPKK